MEIIVYISHHDKNKTLVENIIGKLKEYYSQIKISNEKISIDDRLIKPTLNMLDEAHCVIAFMNKTALTSLEVIDELARAHDRHLPMLIFIDNHLTSTDLPWYLSKKEAICINLEKQDDANILNNIFNRILKFFKNINTENKTQLLKHANYFRNLILSKNSDYIPYKHALLEQELLSCYEHIQSVLSGHYNYHNQQYKSFFHTITPMIKTAKILYMISIASNEKFWLNINQKGYAYNFLAQHPLNSCRIFVFSSPDELHQFQHVLDAHYYTYGCQIKYGGGLFITSLDYYQEILETIINDTQVAEKYNQHSIALLKHTGQEYNDEIHELLWSDINFMISDPDLYDPWFKESTLLKFFKEKLELKLGEASKNKKVWRWHPKLHRSDTVYKGLIRDLFSMKDEIWYGQIDYFIFFHNKKLNELFLEKLKRTFSKQLSKCFGTRFEQAIIDISITKTSQALDIIDGRWHGNLKLDEQFPLSLKISFHNHKDFIYYLSHNDTSTIREMMYCGLNPNLKQYYKQLKTATRQEKSTVFQHIEGLANKDTKRVALQKFSILDEIIQLEPYIFKAKSVTSN